MHCNLRLPETRQPFAALIRTPCQVWLSLILSIALLLLIHYFTPWPWPLTLNICMWLDETLYQIIWTQSNNLRWSSCDFNVWSYDLEHVLSVALGSGIIFSKFDLRQLVRAWIIAFFDAGTLCQAVALTFDLLTLKVRGTSSVTWSKSVRNLSEIEQSPAELLIILRIFAHVMSRRDLDPCPRDLELLQHFGCHAFKLCTKFERNRIISGWVDPRAAAVSRHRVHKP